MSSKRFTVTDYGLERMNEGRPTRYEIARSLGISLSTIAKIRNGLTVGPDTAQIFVDAYGPEAIQER